MRPPDFPLHLMGTLKCWCSLHGYIVVFIFLTAVSTGSMCDTPTSPQCFKRKADEDIYFCEWSMSATETNVTYDLYIGKKIGNTKKTWYELKEEQLSVNREVPIWVEAHVGNSSCSSTRTSAVLKHTVKYEAPWNVSMSWFKNNLSLSWTAAETYPALAEVRFRRDEHPTESWESRMTNTTSERLTYQVIVVDLLKHTAYQVQIRHRSNQASNPLWSDWSPVVIVPAELEQEPEVSMTTRLVNGARKVTLKWKQSPHAAAATGLTYSLRDTQSSHGCPCQKGEHRTSSNKYTTYISYSAANISVIASNAAGCSPPAVIQIPAEGVADVKPCNKTLLDEKLNKTICLELYEVQDGDLRPENVITLTTRKKKRERQRIRKTVKIFTRYLYFEHICAGKPQTVQTCLFYQKEGVPLREPRDFVFFGETYSSVNLSWKAIPTVDQRGFRTHYSLCIMKISSEPEMKTCHNISASLLNHHLEDLTPGAKYNISLAVVTREGEGPRATLTINMLPEKHLNVLLYILSLLFVLFLISTTCNWISRRIKSKILPPVPKPVIPNFNLYQPESEDMLERKEEVDKLSLHQLLPECKSVPGEAEETNVLGGERDDGSDEDVENESGDSWGISDEHLIPGSLHQALKSSREGGMTALEQVDKQIALLIYRNGLVFDLKADST